MTILVIVESPTKAKTIQKFLGSGYIVKASMGHIRDLEKKTNHFGIDVANNFMPSYTITKADQVKLLRGLMKNAQEVILASDEDREGEAIAWHLSEVLKLKSPKRIVFHEITKKAIEHAIKNPRTIDMNMVNSQQARRVLDRLVGFELSPILWNYIKGELSAGRVQSIATRLIVDKEKEIQKFQTAPYFKVNAIFIKDKVQQLAADLDKHIESKEPTMKFLEICKKAIFAIEDIDCKLQKRNPSPPFETSSLQQEAGRKLHMSAKQIMDIAQKLYEAGYITYHRTDCTILSNQILADIKNYVSKTYGDNYVHVRQYQTKAKNAQEAHEAIRPTDILRLSLGDSELAGSADKLYQMIWKRTVASQMKACEVNVFTATISISNQEEYKFISKAEEIVFDGYLRVYNYDKENNNSDDEQESEPSKTIDNLAIIKALKKGDVLNYLEINAKETYTKPPARYTEPTLNKKMKVLGIGRPSTYASIISTVQDRGYVEKKSVKGKQVNVVILKLKESKIMESSGMATLNSDNNKLFPTEIGIKTTEFLIDKFANILNYDFTSKMETELDNIAEGSKIWHKVVGEFYETFHPIVDKLRTEKPSVEREKKLVGVSDDGVEMFAYSAKYGNILEIGDKKYKIKDDVSLETIDPEKAKEIMENSYPKTLGMHNEKKVVLKDGKFGVYMEYNGKNYNVKCNKGEEQSFTLEQAIEVIDSQNSGIGDYNGKPVKLKEGKFGKYLEYDGKNYNLKSNEEITLETAIEAIEEKNKKIIKTINETVKIMNGPYGAYISFGNKKYVSIPKDRDPAALTLQDCKNLEEIDKIKKGNQDSASKASWKKSTYTKNSYTKKK